MTQAELLATAFEHQMQGRSAQAEALYRQILAADPRQSDALHRLGVLCLHTGRGDEAISLLHGAVAIQPDRAEYLNHLGGAYGTLERYEEATTVLRRAVQTNPNDAVAHYNLGNALAKLDRTNEALQSYRNAVAADPNYAEAHNNLGSALRDLHRLDEAEVSIRNALRVRPGYVKALVNLGCVQRDLAHFDEAIETFRSAAALDPSHGRAVLNLGVVLRDAGRYVEAHDTLRRAVEMMPDDAQAHANLGTSFQVLARFDEARACYEKAVDLDPELGEAHFGRATLRLREGDFAGGFEEFEWRWKCSTFRDRGFPQPRWEGQPLEGRTILLYAEQGLGDAINFVRFAADAKQRGGRVIVECQPPLTTILATCRAVDQTTPIGSPQPAFDVHAPLLSLPGILKLTEDQFWRGPYLAADPKLVDVWRQRLEKHAGFRIGLCWHGNPEHQCDSQRSIALANFAPLAAVPGTKFFSLQKEADAYEMISAGFEVIDLRPEFDQEAAPFLNAAAIIKALDLVVTCDTAIAHLAGALGAPVWTAISAHSDWRWLLEREDSPWYPSMRLFRQSQLDLWDDVFERIAQALAERVAAAG